MGICWYCSWGWSKPVSDIYGKYVALLREANPNCDPEILLGYQHGHIVWAEENFDDHSIKFCLTDTERYWNKNEVSKREHDLITQSLEELLIIPEEIRDPCPENYPLDDNDVDPADYPPAEGIVMIKKW